jgi:hypothetical protein
MQYILSLDFSSNPSELTVSLVDGMLVEVQQRRTIELELFLDGPSLLREEFASLTPRFSENGTSALTDSTLPQTNPTDDRFPLPPSPASASDNNPLESTEVLKSRINSTVKRLKEALVELDPVWTACVVTMPPFNNVAMNLSLPFGDAKNLARIVDLEVQDVVPFDLDDFLVQYSSLGSTSGVTGTVQGTPPGGPSTSASLPTGGGQFDVHIGLAPRSFVRNILSLCKAVGLEPLVMTVPSSTLGAVYHIARDYFKGNSAILMARKDAYSLVVNVHGQARVEHTIRPENLAPRNLSDTSEGSAADQQRVIFTALKLMIAAVERKYETRVDTLHVLVGPSTTPVKISLLQQVLGRPVESFELKDVVKLSDPLTGIAPLSSIFGLDDSPAPVLSNFRAREFSYSPKFGELLRVLQSTWRHVLGAALAVVIALIGYYGMVEYKISSMKSYLTEQMRSVISDFNAPDGDYLKTLGEAEAKLSEDLGVLSSPSTITPVDVLVELSERIPSTPGVVVTGLKIYPTKATLTGVAPDLSAIEKIEKEIKKNKTDFATVKANPGNASGSRYNFSVDIVYSK